jgi:hypothetical protein
VIRANERMVFHKYGGVDIQYKPFIPHLKVRWGNSTYSVTGTIIPGSLFTRWMEIRDVVNKIPNSI